MPHVGLRLTEEQHSRLLERAGNQAVSAYVKQQLALEIPGYDPWKEVHDELTSLDRRLSELERLAGGSSY
jgi:hypothetical protein